MSNALLNAAFKAVIPQARKFVLVALCDYANDAGECFPSVQQLMARCSMSDRGVQKCIVELVAGGYLKRDFRRGRSTVYIVTDPRTWFTPNDVHPEQGSPQPRTTFTPEQGSPPNDVHPAPECGSGAPEQGSPITTTQPSLNPVCREGEGRGDSEVEERRAHDLAAVTCLEAMIAEGIEPLGASANNLDFAELIKAGHRDPDVWRRAAALALDKRSVDNPFEYAIGIVRRRTDAARAPPRVVAKPTKKPAVTDDFKDTSYGSTAIENMPAVYRDALAVADRAG